MNLILSVWAFIDFVHRFVLNIEYIIHIWYNVHAWYIWLNTEPAQIQCKHMYGINGFIQLNVCVYTNLFWHYNLAFILTIIYYTFGLSAQYIYWPIDVWMYTCVCLTETYFTYIILGSGWKNGWAAFLTVILLFSNRIIMFYDMAQIHTHRREMKAATDAWDGSLEYTLHTCSAIVSDFIR